MTSMRISGFNSGLDIDAMVKQMMKAERAKLDKLKQSQTSITWQQEQYRDISTSLVDFRNNKLSKYNTLNSLSAKVSEVTGNTAAVSVTSTSSGASGSLSVTVQNLATSASLLAQTGAASVKADTKMSGLNISGSTSNEISITSGGKEYKFTFQPEELVSDVVARINSNKELNATLMIGSGGELSIRSNATGKNELSINAPSLLKAGSAQPPVDGLDATYTVNGISMKSASNYVSVNGFNLQLKAETGSAGASTVSSKLDTDSIVNTIKSFISDYNSLLDQVNTKLNEQRYRTYSPLTEEQKADMKESEVTLWESKAKSGLLKNDSILSSMVTDMRTALVSTVTTGTGDNAIKTVQSLGIVTGQWSEYGKLKIQDEQQLRAAIEKNPEQVIALFTSKDPSPLPDTDPNKLSKSVDPKWGIFERLSSTVMKSLQQLTEKAGTSSYSTDKNGTFMANSMLGEQLRTLDTRISDMNRLLTNKENRYYKQFTAMETAINRYSSQSGAFGSQ
ncbi:MULTISPECIES: flagellar filament capping protein FliD [Paenibacillus]|nr:MULTISPECIES: flagellar filament capping protein FliD [Paenibacillus]